MASDYQHPISAHKSKRAYDLIYREQPVPNKQARLKGRTKLVPVIDLYDYTCRAVVDWIVIRIKTARPTQPKWINDKIEKAIGSSPRVDHCDQDNPDNINFVVRIQEPTLKMLLAAKDAVRSAPCSLAGDVEVHAIEVSLDFKPRAPSEEALARMFGVLVRSHYPSRDVFENVLDRPRYVWGRGQPKPGYVLGSDPKRPDRIDQFLLDPSKDSPATFDSTYYVGARGSSPSWRTMVKLVDQQNPGTGTRRDLPESEHRVRIEVTLGRDEIADLGLRTIDDLPSFRFQTLQGRYFAFRLPTFEIVAIAPAKTMTPVRLRRQQLRRERFLNAGVLGLQAMDEAWERAAIETQKVSRKTDVPLPPRSRIGKGAFGRLVRYKELTVLAMQALRHIDERMMP